MLRCLYYRVMALGLSFLPIFTVSSADLEDPRKAAALEKENQSIQADSENIQKLYELGKGENWRDVTQEVLANQDTSPESQASIREWNRRIIVFKYPSDGLWIKGFFSYTPNPDYHPLLILYRWGNMDFALMNPGIDFATYRNYTVISSTLRGGVSEGSDEYGGKDVDDMKNLMNFLPSLSKDLGISLHPPCVFMIGPSRGGLEMFLTLARFPELQKHVSKIVSLSGLLDLNLLIKDRPDDMKKVFQNSFGLENGAKGEAWISKRDPINTVPFLKKSLPILIVQGTADKRIDLAEGRHMVNLLKDSGHTVDYWEIPHGEHTLINTPHIMSTIARWLESNSACTSIYLPRKKD